MIGIRMFSIQVFFECLDTLIAFYGFNRNNSDDTRLDYNYLLLFRFKFKQLLAGIFQFKQKVQFSRALGGECA